MGLVLSEKDIEEHLKNLGNPYSAGMSVWAVKITLRSPVYAILNFSNEGISVMDVNGSGSFNGNDLFFPKGKIKSISFKKKLLSYKCHIDTDMPPENPSFSFSLRKLFIGSKWHTQNLKKILLKYGDNE